MTTIIFTMSFTGSETTLPLCYMRSFVTTTLKSWRKYHGVTIQITPLWSDSSIVLFILKDFIKKKMGKFFLLPMREVKELIQKGF